MAANTILILPAVGTGLWPDFSKMDEVHEIEQVTRPIPENNAVYEKLLPVFTRAGQYQSELGEMLANLHI